MLDIETQRQRRLEAIAQQDAAYQLWKRCYAETFAQFEKFANAQPDETRNYLWGYAEAGRLMYQRMVNLACCHMVFTDESTDTDASK